MDPVNIAAKFEVRSFTHSWDNRGTQKNWEVPGYAHTPFSPNYKFPQLTGIWQPLPEEPMQIFAYSLHFRRLELLVKILPLIMWVYVYYFSCNYLSQWNDQSLK